MTLTITLIAIFFGGLFGLAVWLYMREMSPTNRCHLGGVCDCSMAGGCMDTNRKPKWY